MSVPLYRVQCRQAGSTSGDALEALAPQQPDNRLEMLSAVHFQDLIIDVRQPGLTMFQHARALLNRYVRSMSGTQVNLRGPTRDQLLYRLQSEDVTPTLFDVAQYGVDPSESFLGRDAAASNNRLVRATGGDNPREAAQAIGDHRAARHHPCGHLTSYRALRPTGCLDHHHAARACRIHLHPHTHRTARIQMRYAADPHCNPGLQRAKCRQHNDMIRVCSHPRHSQQQRLAQQGELLNRINLE